MITFLSGCIRKIKRYNFKNINYRLILYIFILTTIGIISISSASQTELYRNKQILGFALGIVVLIVVSLINYNFILRFYWVFYAINIVLLLFVRLFGAERGGAERWLDLGFVQIQPAEFSKFFLILFFAFYLSKYRERINEWKFLLLTLVLFFIPLLLVVTQPALSTSIVIFLTICGIIFSAGLGYKIIGRILGIVIPVAVIMIVLAMVLPNHLFLKEYQYNRIIGFYDEDNEVAARIRYQQENSVMAIGSGGLLGKGLSNNTETSVKNGNFISEPHTDFIFAVVGEEMGFVGSFVVIIVMALLVFECFLVGMKSRNFEGRLVGYAFGTLIAVQAFINMAVVTMLIPNTGITLPFVSYGLSSLLSLFAGMGVIVNIGLQQRTKRVSFLGGYDEHRFDRT